MAALNAPTLVERDGPMATDALSEYWVASRCRLDHWGRALRLLGYSQTAVNAAETPTLAALCEEIVLSEVFARVFAAITHAHDQQSGSGDAGPIGRNAHDGCLDAQRRLRGLAAAWWPAESPKRRLLRSLEKRAAHWSDVLIAYVARCGDVQRFAHDQGRLREFAYDAHPHNGASSEAVGELLRYALRSGFAAATQPPVCGDLNTRVCGSALGCFPASSFDSLGLLRRPWMIRAERSAEEAAEMVEELLFESSGNAAMQTPERWRW